MEGYLKKKKKKKKKEGNREYYDNHNSQVSKYCERYGACGSFSKQKIWCVWDYLIPGSVIHNRTMALVWLCHLFVILLLHNLEKSVSVQRKSILYYTVSFISKFNK